MSLLYAELFQQAHQRILQDRNSYGPGIMQDPYRGPFKSLSPLIIRHGRNVVPGRHRKQPVLLGNAKGRRQLTGKQGQRSAHVLFVRHFQRGDETSEQHAGTCGVWPCFVAVRFRNAGAQGSKSGASCEFPGFGERGPWGRSRAFLDAVMTVMSVQYGGLTLTVKSPQKTSL